MSLAGFDAYRDEKARQLMVEFVMRSKIVDARAAVNELRGLNHVGLAYVYQDALASAVRANSSDYDPCAVR